MKKLNIVKLNCPGVGLSSHIESGKIVSIKYSTLNNQFLFSRIKDQFVFQSFLVYNILVTYI